jgi:hypothetical protein
VSQLSSKGFEGESLGAQLFSLGSTGPLLCKVLISSQK